MRVGVSVDVYIKSKIYSCWGNVNDKLVQVTNKEGPSSEYTTPATVCLAISKRGRLNTRLYCECVLVTEG